MSPMLWILVKDRKEIWNYDIIPGGRGGKRKLHLNDNDLF